MVRALGHVLPVQSGEHLVFEADIYGGVVDVGGSVEFLSQLLLLLPLLLVFHLGGYFVGDYLGTLVLQSLVIAAQVLNLLLELEHL